MDYKKPFAAALIGVVVIAVAWGLAEVFKPIPTMICNDPLVNKGNNVCVCEDPYETALINEDGDAICLRLGNGPDLPGMGGTIPTLKEICQKYPDFCPIEKLP